MIPETSLRENFVPSDVGEAGVNSTTGGDGAWGVTSCAQQARMIDPQAQVGRHALFEGCARRSLVYSPSTGRGHSFQLAEHEEGGG